MPPVRQVKIMISSTRADLAQYREEASRIIREVALEKENQVQLVEVSMEKETQSGEREFAVAVSKRWIEKADWVVVIVGFNYGTISSEQDADGLSVTEWEYKHAVARDKKIFVFMAGHPETADEYRCSTEERVDLKNWMMDGKQTNDQKEKLQQFKANLGKSFLTYFGNLPKFRERLGITLKKAIDDLPPEIQPGTKLESLIVEVSPHIRNCIEKVTLINYCKQIHDYLHELRQHAIRPLREEVLSKWEQDVSLSLSRERILWRLVNCASQQIGGIKGMIWQSMGPEAPRIQSESVDYVLNRFELWSQALDAPDSLPSREDFTEGLDIFANAVQDAFSDADHRMIEEERDLGDRYLELLECLSKARQQCDLASSDNVRLDEELVKVRANRKRVQKSLTNHHSWQEAHDKLHDLGSNRNTGRFNKIVNYYRESPLSYRLLSLVDDEVRKAARNEADHSETVQDGCACGVQHDSSQLSQGCPHTCSIFVENLKRLKHWLEAFRNGGGENAFDEMRKPFDDTFYCVDKRTLVAVSRAGERAKDLKRWLNDLHGRRLGRTQTLITEA